MNASLGKLSDSASGTMLLAFRDEVERTSMIAAPIRIHGATDVSRTIFGINQEVIAALTVPCIERLDRPQSPSIADVESLVREMAGRLSELMCYTGHNAL